MEKYIGVSIFVSSYEFAEYQDTYDSFLTVVCVINEITIFLLICLLIIFMKSNKKDRMIEIEKRCIHT